MIEKEYPTLEEEKDEEKEEGDESQRELSAEEMMRKEVEGLKSKTSTTQAVVSLQTVSPPHSYSLLLPHSSTRILPATFISYPFPSTVLRSISYVFVRASGYLLLWYKLWSYIS
jgi:hypothetical protein